MVTTGAVAALRVAGRTCPKQTGPAIKIKPTNAVFNMIDSKRIFQRANIPDSLKGICNNPVTARIHPGIHLGRSLAPFPKDKKGQAKWFNENSKVTYLVANKKQNELKAGTITLYSRPDGATGELHIVYDDGAAEAIDAKKADEVEKELKAGKNPPPSLKGAR
jgi:hypothetical protein